MANRDRPRLTALLGVLLMGLATLGVVGEAAAQAPPPEGSDPGAAPPPAAGGAPATNPPPKTGQPAAPPPGAGQPGGAPPPGGAAPAPPPRPSPLSIRARETQLKVELGGEFFVPFGFGVDDIVGAGPAFKLSALWLRWWGPFMLGGGPSLRYSYMVDNRDNPDYIHQMTVNGEFIIGGGIYQKFAIYCHVLLGLGAFKAYDADTDTSITFFMARAVGGIGGWAHITRWLSIGGVVDIGWPGTVQVLASVGFHFGRRL